MSVSRFGEIQANVYLGSSHDNSPFGKIWYVDVTNGSDGNAGDAPDQAYASIGAAISAAVATRGDSVHIAPGTYTITSALSPKAFMTFRAAVINPQAPSVSIRGNLATLMNVDVNGCRFIGLEFRATGTTVRDLVRLADTTAVTGGALFEDCVFHGADQLANQAQGISGVAGLWTDGTNAVTGLVVRRCLFRDLGKTQLEIGAGGVPYATIEDNLFAIDTDQGWGISLADTAAFATGKGYSIRNNVFIGPDAVTATQIGIRIAGTQNITGAGIITNNYFSYCADIAITQDVLMAAIVQNFSAANTGGSVIDGSSI